jgi:hypothetical protein
VTRKPLDHKGRMVPQVHMTRKPLGPIGQMKIEKGVVESHKSDGEGSISTSDMQAIGSHRSDGDRERPHRFGSHMSDGEGSHRYTSHGERIKVKLL